MESSPFLCKERLNTEPSVLYKRKEFRSISGFMKMFQIMLNTRIGDFYTEVFTLLQMIIITLITTAESERCSWTLRRMKSLWSSTIPQDSFSALAMFSAEKVMMTENIINFNDKVLDKFTNHKAVK